MTKGVYSDFEVKEMGIKILSAPDAAYKVANCVGTSEEEMETKVVTKSCRGTLSKKKVRGTGAGTLSLSLHMPWEIYTEAYGMNLDTLVEGVKAYGMNSKHEALAITQHIYDEDGIEKYKAYPNCIIESGKISKIENGAEEVAEIEIEVSILPDEYGNGVYEAIATEITDETLKTKWMNEFTPDLVQVESA